MHAIGTKFIAFRGPSAEHKMVGPGVYTLTPSDYIDAFKQKGVTAVVRLNSAQVPFRTMSFGTAFTCVSAINFVLLV
jgi:hypothetical protein